MAGEVSFFELGVEDPAPAGEPYGELFGWRLQAGSSGEGHGFAIETPNIPCRGPSGTFAFCRDNQRSSFGLHQAPG